MPRLISFVHSLPMTQPRQLLSPLLVGRDDMLALAERRTADAKAGRGSLLLFAGEAGIGKSRLLGATIRQAVLGGYRYAKGDIAPQDGLVPLASIRDLARSMVADDFDDLGRRLLELRGGKSGDTLASRRIFVRELAETIIDAIDRPTLLAFEDLQWADELTLEVVGDLARLGHDRPLLLLGTYRPEELPVGSIHREWRSRLLTQRLAQELRLERLSPDETALVTSLILATGLPASREVASAVYERTNGIPLHIEELLAALGPEVETDGRSIRDVAVPDTIEDAVLARLARLSEDARALARAASVMGRCFDPDVLAGIMDRAVNELDGPLTELVDSSILFPFDFVDRGYYDFRHQLLRDALYGTVPAGELRRLHARAGEFGAELVGASEIHASLHFERAGLRAQAFRAALTGARAASAMSSRREAFELYRRAVTNMPATLEPAEKAAMYDEYDSAASAVDDVEAMEEASREARRNYQEAGDALGAARALAFSYGLARRDVRPRGEREAIVATAETELLALAPSAERDSILAQVWLDRAFLELDAGHTEAAAAGMKAAAELQRRAGQPDPDYDMYSTIPRILAGDVDGGLQAILDAARAAREARLETSSVSAYRVAAWMAVRVMDYPAAEIGLTEGLRYADDIEQSFCRHQMASASAQCAWAAGRWDDAVHVAELELVDRVSRRSSVGSRNALAYVALGRGMVDRARNLLDDSLAISRPSGELDLILPALWGHAEAALIGGDPARAMAHCEEALELLRGTSERPHLVPFVVTGVRAALADRRPEAAERWLRGVGPLLADWSELAGPALSNAEGVLKLAAGSLVAARTSLEAAVAGWDAVGRIWEASWARADLATCLLRSNRHVEAQRTMAEVEAAARRLDSAPLQARAEELTRQGRGRGDHEAWYPLTVREFEVAKAIAEGKTNGEIGAELFVSPKTVSAHVEHILAKLGVARRAEVAAWTATITTHGSDASREAGGAEVVGRA
jgi:DNA-binding CsgD family transcriptional regulator